MKRNYLLMSLMTLAVVAAITVAAVAPSYVVRARSGWSCQTFWLFYDSRPSEKQLYNAVLAWEPSLSADIDIFEEAITVDSTARAERDAMSRAGYFIPPPPDLKPNEWDAVATRVFTVNESLSHFGNWSKAGLRTTQGTRKGGVWSPLGEPNEKWSNAEFLNVGSNVFVKGAGPVEASQPARDLGAVREGSALVLTPFDGKNYDVMDAGKTPDQQQAQDGKFGPATAHENVKIKAVWLTEPSTRTEFLPLATRTAYFLATLLVGFIAAFLGAVLIGYLMNNLFFTLAAAGLFLAAFAPTEGYGEHVHSVLPNAYFEVLRCAVCGVSCYGAFKLRGRQGWLWTMVGVAVLFNPIVPARFSREAWQVIDAAAGIFFLISIVLFKKRTNKEQKTKSEVAVLPDMDVANILTVADYERPRNAEELSQWWSAIHASFRLTKEGAIYCREGRGLSHRFYDEARPMVVFMTTYFVGTNIRCRLSAGDDPADAVLLGKNNLTIKQLQITSAVDGYTEHLRREELTKSGSVDGLGMPIITGSGRSKSVVFPEDGMEANDSIVSRTIQNIQAAVKNKVAKHYPSDLSLVVGFNDSCLRREDTLEFEKAYREIKHTFAELFLVGFCGTIIVPQRLGGNREPAIK
jgi:hypothetical protein